MAMTITTRVTGSLHSEPSPSLLDDSLLARSCVILALALCLRASYQAFCFRSAYVRGESKLIVDVQTDNSRCLFSLLSPLSLSLSLPLFSYSPDIPARESMDVDTPTPMDVHVECVQQRRSLSKLQDVCSRVLAFLCETLGKGLPGTAVKDFLGDSFLAEHVEELYIAPLHDSASRQVGSSPLRITAPPLWKQPWSAARRQRPQQQHSPPGQLRTGDLANHSRARRATRQALPQGGRHDHVPAQHQL